MSGTAKVLAVTEFERPLELVEVPLPDPEPGAILVEMEVATLCGSDVHHWEGMHRGVFDFTMPLCSGHEGVGRIVKFGPGAQVDSVGQTLTLGDRLVWEHEPCGHCHECTVLHDEVLCRNRKTGLWRTVDEFPFVAGTFGTHAYVWPNAGRLRVPDGVASEWASGASCAMRTVVAAIEKLGPVGPEHNVLIQGAGPLGLYATALLSLRSPQTLTVVGAPDDRLALARDWGATHTVSIADLPDRDERRRAVQELTGGRGPDVLLELAGVAGAVAEGFELAAPDARYVVVGTAAAGQQSVAAHLITNKQLTVRGSFSASIGSYWKAFDLLERYADRFEWDRMLSGRYPLSGVTDALIAMGRGEAIKPVVLTQEL